MDEPITLASILLGGLWCFAGLVIAGYSRAYWGVDWKSEHVAVIAMLGPTSIPILFALATFYRIMHGDWPWNQ